jgi:hypothetical protein
MMSPQVNYALYAFLIEENNRKIKLAQRGLWQPRSRSLFQLSGNLLVRLGNWLQEHAQTTDPSTAAHTI